MASNATPSIRVCAVYAPHHQIRFSTTKLNLQWHKPHVDLDDLRRTIFAHLELDPQEYTIELHKIGACVDVIEEDVLPREYLNGNVIVMVHVDPIQTLPSTGLNFTALPLSTTANASSSIHITHSATVLANAVDQDLEDDLALAADGMDVDGPGDESDVISSKNLRRARGAGYVAEDDAVDTTPRSSRNHTTSLPRFSRQDYGLRGASKVSGSRLKPSSINTQSTADYGNSALTSRNSAFRKRKAIFPNLPLADDHDPETLPRDVTDDEDVANQAQLAGTEDGISGEADLEYVRIGTYPWLERHPVKGTVENQIKLEAIMVAQIDMDEIKAHRDWICFLLVDSWTINGVQLGHLSMGDLHKKGLFNKKGRPIHCVPDAVFENCNTKRAVATKAIAMAHEKRRPAGKKPIARKRKTLRTMKTQEYPQALPTEPTISDEAFDGLQSPKADGNVDVLIFFVNNTNVDIDLKLPVNYQASIPHGMNHDQFNQEHILESDDDNFTGLNGALAKSLTDHWNVEIFVVPHRAGSAEMHSWTERKNWTINQWLARDMTAQYGKQLYIEVHIVPKEGEEDLLDISDAAKRAFKGQEKEEKEAAKGKKAAKAKEETKKTTKRGKASD